MIASTEQCSGLLKMLLQRLRGLQVMLPADSHDAFKSEIIEIANCAERRAWDAHYAAREIVKAKGETQ